MKKFFKGLIITLVVLIILPIALAFIFLFDTSRMKVEYDDNFTVEKWSKSLVVDSLDSAPSLAKAKFVISENDINNYIHAQIKDNAELQKYLTQLAIDIKEDSYVLNVSGKVYFFESRAKLTAKLTKEPVNDKEAIVLSVDKMALGRLSHIKGLVMFFLKTFVNDSTIDALTSSIKLHSDLDNSRLYIYMDDFRDMINKSVNGGSGSSEFYFSFINDFFDMNLITIDFYGDDALNINVNLEPLTGNDYDATVGDNVYYPMNYDATTTKLKIGEEEKKLSLNVIREALVSLLDKHIIQVADMPAVSDYLFQGYKLNNAPTFDLSSIGISDAEKETYKGFNVVSDSSVDDIIRNAAATYTGYTPSLDEFNIASISEADLNTFIKAQDVLGHKYFLQKEVADSKNKVNYIAIDNAYMNFYGNNSVISVGLNINGLETMLTLKLELDATASNKDLVYNVNKVYFGKEEKNLAISEDTKKTIFKTLADSMKESTFKFTEEGQLVISFEGIIQGVIDSIDTSASNPIGAAYKAFLENNADFKVSVQGDNVTDNALIKIMATRR